MSDLKDYITAMMIRKLNESRYDTDFKKIEWLGNYDIKNASSSGNKLFLEIEDADDHEVTIEYSFKKTPRGITIEGQWSRETSSSNSRDDFGKTTKVSIKNLDGAIDLFSKSLKNKDVNKVISKLKTLRI